MEPTVTMKNRTLACYALLCAMSAPPAFGQSAKLGIFTDEGDVGTVGKAGATVYDAGKGEFVVTGGGANMWTTNDAFHFVWKKMSGDLKLAADISFLSTNGNEHRKGCLVIRQALTADSPYLDVAVHG